MTDGGGFTRGVYAGGRAANLIEHYTVYILSQH